MRGLQVGRGGPAATCPALARQRSVRAFAVLRAPVAQPLAPSPSPECSYGGSQLDGPASCSFLAWGAGVGGRFARDVSAAAFPQPSSSAGPTSISGSPQLQRPPPRPTSGRGAPEALQPSRSLGQPLRLRDPGSPSVARDKEGGKRVLGLANQSIKLQDLLQLADVVMTSSVSDWKTNELYAAMSFALQVG
jgi:hypothetical protein